MKIIDNLSACIHNLIIIITFLTSAVAWAHIFEHNHLISSQPICVNYVEIQSLSALQIFCYDNFILTHIPFLGFGSSVSGHMLDLAGDIGHVPVGNEDRRGSWVVDIHLHVNGFSRVHLHDLRGRLFPRLQAFSGNYLDIHTEYYHCNFPPSCSTWLILFWRPLRELPDRWLFHWSQSACCSQ